MANINTLKEQQSKFIWYSIRERMAMTWFAKAQKYQIEEFSNADEYQSWDVIYTNPNNEAISIDQIFNNDHLTNIAEIKIRNRNSDEFSGKWIFEKIKYDALIKAASDIHVPVFIVFFNDCVAIWDLTQIKDIDFQTETLRHHSVTGSTDKIDKEVTYLHIGDAQRINYTLYTDRLNLNSRVVFKYLYPNNYDSLDGLEINNN